MRLLYSLLFYLVMPFVWLRLLWRARRNPDYAKRWQERLAHFSQPIHPNSLWIHAVSVGEVLAAVPLIKKLQEHYPQLPLLITTMTPTGSKQVWERFGNTVQHVYAPYDLPHVVKRFLHQVKPCGLVIIETEIWPNLLHYCHAQQIKIMLTNARMSQKSARGYARFKNSTRNMLNHIDIVAVQNETDGQRFLNLGLAREKLQVTGTIKFDITISDDILRKAKTFRRDWQRDVFIAASTHPGEETIILDAFKTIRKKFPNLLLVLVPRHPDRTKEVLELCHKENFSVVTRQSQETITNATDIFLIDTLGELILFYATSDVAFVGGSLIERGGHNVLEPAALGIPVITGKSMFNFAAIEKLLLHAHALIQVINANQLSDHVCALLSDKTLHQKIGLAGKDVIEKNRGALEKQFKLIEQLMSLQ